MSGIFRDVYLWSPASVHIRDFEVKTDLDAAYQDATLNVAVKLDQLRAAGGHQSHSKPACSIRPARALSHPPASRQFEPGKNVTVEAVAPVTNPLKWSAETPNLYQLLLTLKDAVGQNARSHSRQRRLPQSGNPRRQLARQRPARPLQRRQPP